MPARRLARLMAHCLAATPALLAVTCAPTVQAAAAGLVQPQAALFDFQVPAGTMEQALVAIARSAGGIVLFDPAAAARLNCAGVQGRFTLEAALRQALAGSPLELVSHPDGSFGVLRASVPAALSADPATPEHYNPPLPPVLRSGQRDAGDTSHGYADSGFLATESRLATRNEMPLSSLPVSLQEITGGLIESQQSQSVVSSLQNISSVAYGRGDGVDQAGTLYVRSFVAPVMRDGWGDLVSLVNATNGRVSGSRAITSLDVPTAAIERVEVLGGADSIIVGGPMEPGGSVNIVTKQPVADTLRELTLEVDQRGHRRSALDLGGSLSADRAWTYRTIVSVTHDKRTLDGYDGAREFYLAPSLGYKDASTSVVAGLSHQVARTPFGGYQSALLGENGPGPDLRSAPWGRADDRSLATKTELFYRWEQALGEDWRFTSRARINRLRYRAAGYTNCAPVDLDAGTGVCVADQSLLQTDSISLDNNVSYKIVSGPWQHRIMAGASFSRTRLRSYSDGDNSVAVNVPWPPSQAALPPLSGQPSLTGGDDAIYTSNLYLQDQITWQRWYALINAGYERERNNFSSDVDADGVLRDTSPPRNVPVYNLGLAYRLSQNATLYANYFRSFTPGQVLLDSSLNGSRPGINSAPATTGRSAEIGLKLELLERRAVFTAALFRATHTNVLQSVFADASAPLNRYVLLPSAVSRGLELNLSGRLARGWNLIASYSYSLFHPAPGPEQDSRLGQFPHHRASLWSTYDLQSEAWRGWGFGLGMTARSGYTAVSDADTQVRIGGQTRTDASLYYRRPGSRTTLGIRNLFDRRLFSDFATNLIGVEPGRTLTLTHIIEF
ncbi:TonB-dependent receptor [Herbaspirillum seropedicae]|uniref:TonB-dependent siderophore receptor protein n=1 Tax=Herbaspirillum seropedicae (strain SmR1) TaxID=757424 RepID=D8IQA2_HERSS|nr:TonB-dependent receptor [Herbaspirillum seropedicae]ADJ65014.1 TonB-dependent siderophore receptor protein [Herbaspirillum seropedicae SmR1]AKN66890.1 TonB-dependent receptor [Herbaspirillum seropedicae]NQE28097.1 TonB-dependent receptor [Herbaspirillum seropedicae]UMU22888.1 TonB-dependent receptor [Herbaspirillum seropedicae]